jgi:nucleotide-binding universal stress UspA family protein
VADRLAALLVVVHAERDDARVSHGEELLARLAVENGLGTSVERLVGRGEPAEALVEAAASRAAELVVTGSRGRGAHAAATLGSVSSALATRAPCPVAVVRAVPAPAGG